MKGMEIFNKNVSSILFLLVMQILTFLKFTIYEILFATVR